MNLGDEERELTVIPVEWPVKREEPVAIPESIPVEPEHEHSAL